MPVKLPGQTRVSPEEYREFLNLGHGDIFNLDVDAVVDAPWRCVWPRPMGRVAQRVPGSGNSKGIRARGMCMAHPCWWHGGVQPVHGSMWPARAIKACTLHLATTFGRIAALTWAWAPHSGCVCRYPGIDPGDFFNYGLTERTWKEYCQRVQQFRVEFMLQGQIQTLDAAAPGPPGRRPAHGGPPAGAADAATGAAAGVEGGMEAGTHTLGTLDDQEDAHYEAFVTSERPPVRAVHVTAVCVCSAPTQQKGLC